jgi:hypothetical protein
MLCRSLFALFLLAIVLSVLLDIRILITSLVSSNSSNSIQIFNGEFIEPKEKGQTMIYKAFT